MIARATAQVLLPVMALVSIFALFNGHSAPGGGFLGGLLAGAGFLLYAMAEGTERLRVAFASRLALGMMIGLLLIFGSGVLGLIHGVFLRAVWLKLGPVSVGSPLLFDIGVYLVVVTVVLGILLARPSNS